MDISTFLKGFTLLKITIALVIIGIFIVATSYYKGSDGTVVGFTTVWHVGYPGYGNGDKTVQFFITTTTSPMVDWGDGTIEPIAIGNVTPFTTINATPSHTYRSSGDYTIKISGISAFSNYSKKDLYHGKLLSVTDWGGIEWTNMQIMFKYANHLNLFPATGPNMEKVGDMNQMFFGATTFNQSLANFNTENVRDMSEMFYGATEFNQSLLSFNTAKVTDMVSMFNGARAFNQPLLSFNTVNVTDMSTMFVEAIAFNQNISNWCVSLIGGKPLMFDIFGNTGFTNNTPIQPQWGTCPNGEPVHDIVSI